MRVAAETFRSNPNFKTEDAITTLETGEALVSFLDEKGAPGIVQKAKILFPLSQIGAISENERRDIINASTIGHKYDVMVDRESAYEKLVALSVSETTTEVAETEKDDKRSSSGKKKTGIAGKVLKAVITAVTATFATAAGTAVSDAITGKKTKSRTSTKQKVVKNATSAATRTASREIIKGGGEIFRDILGNIVK